MMGNEAFYQMNFYVSPQGDDVAGKGTLEAPWRSIEKAKEHLRKLPDKATGDVTVFLRPGRYYINKTIEFSQEDSAPEGNRIRYVAEREGEVWLCGTRRLNHFSYCGDGLYCAKLSEEEKVEGAWPEFRDLYVNDQRRSVGGHTQWNYFADCVLDKATGETSFFIKESDIPDIKSWEGVELVYNREWYLRRMGIKGILPAGDGMVQLIPDENHYLRYMDAIGKYSVKGYQYYFRNHMDFVKEPGSSFYDRKTGVVYYCPFPDEVTAGMLTAEVEYPVVETLISFCGSAKDKVTGISLEGISFLGGTWNYPTHNGYFEQLAGREANTEEMASGIIQGIYASDVAVRCCSFREIGTNGIVLYRGCEGIRLESNIFEKCAMSAIMVGEVDHAEFLESDFCRDIVIHDNSLLNLCQEYLGNVCIGVSNTICGLAITHNSLRYFPYTGIYVGWGWNSTTSRDREIMIAGNLVEAAMHSLVDGAGIYVTGGSPYDSHIIRENVVISNGSSAADSSKGIYLDGGVCNYTVESNIILGYKNQVIHAQTIRDQLIKNNTIKNNWFTLSKQIKGREDVIRAGNVIYGNEKYDMAAELPAEAQDILQKAGSTISLADPLMVETENKHLRLAKDQSTNLYLTITNTSNTRKVYSLQYGDQNNNLLLQAAPVEVLPGQRAVMDVLISTKEDAPASTSAIPICVVVADENGHRIVRKRIVSVQIGLMQCNRILRHTPVIDGIKDEAYERSAVSVSGSVFHREGAEDSQVNAKAWFLWDDQYLYVYMEVSDPKVISRGSKWIFEADVPYCNDNVEVYYSPYGVSSIATRYSVDAYGIAYLKGQERFSAKNSECPYVVRLTKNGKVLDIEYPAEIPEGFCVEEADGYVIEMAIPITAGTEDHSVPENGTRTCIHYQNNDLQNVSSVGCQFAALRNSCEEYIFSKEEA